MSKEARKCVNCDEPATVKFGNDPDLTGVPSCDKCKENVQLALLLSIMNGDDFYKVLKSLKK